MFRIVIAAAVFLLVSQGRPPDIAFRIHAIDPGASETAAVADINSDGRLDIVSGENWYEAPAWTKHSFRDLDFTNNYIDNFSDLPIDVDGDGYPDIVRCHLVRARRSSWWKNPGARARGQLVAGSRRSTPASMSSSPCSPTSTTTARRSEVVAQENGTPQAWYEVKNGAWVTHVVSDKSYGHGIGAGDVNGDGRTDILTPRGWLEAPADPRAGNWTFHADWEAINVRDASDPQPGTRPSPSSASCTCSTSTATAATTSSPAAGHDYGVFWFEQGADGHGRAA